jgi:hypothetical protein
MQLEMFPSHGFIIPAEPSDDTSDHSLDGARALDYTRRRARMLDTY